MIKVHYTHMWKCLDETQQKFIKMLQQYCDPINAQAHN
jgi:hypothetical protein